MKVKILGKTWDLVFRPRLEMGRLLGTCDHPSTIGKEIRILDELRGERLVDTFIHECFHASAHDVFAEDFVNNLAEGIARAIFSPEFLARAIDDEALESLGAARQALYSGEDRQEGATVNAPPAPPVAGR